MKTPEGYEICSETGALKSISREITARYAAGKALFEARNS